MSEYGDGLGRIIVRDGQMRVLAAVETEFTVPLLLANRDTTGASRVNAQLVANDQRATLTPADPTAAYPQLRLACLSEVAAAHGTGSTRETVKVAPAVAKTEGVLLDTSCFHGKTT